MDLGAVGPGSRPVTGPSAGRPDSGRDYPSQAGQPHWALHLSSAIHASVSNERRDTSTACLQWYARTNARRALRPMVKPTGSIRASLDNQSIGPVIYGSDLNHVSTSFLA